VSGKTKGTIYALICIALWGLIPVVAKIGQTTLDNHQFLFWSSLISFAVLALTTLMTGNLKYLRSYRFRDLLYFIVLGLLGTYIYYLFLYLGYAKATGMEVLVVQYTWPIFVVILSFFILKESFSLRTLVSIVIGFLGVMLVLTKGEYKEIHINNGLVILLVSAGAFCFALFSVLSKSVGKEPLGVISVYFLSACFASFLSMLYFSEFAIPSKSELFPVVLNGIFVNGFSYVLWIAALRSTEASFLAPFVFLSPVLSAVYLILFFNEPFLLVYGIGLMLVIVSGLINSFRFSKKQPTQYPVP
jgi:drug/metabolite transporter (DMT)-like permease